jgi:PIN domain nuclease of toxin-antitoxin system
MAEYVLDSSAILAVVQLEPGGTEIAPLMSRSLVSVVNEAEVISVLIQKGNTVERALNIVSDLPYELVDLDWRTARRAGALWRDFKRRGLSLGDRCCLALSERTSLPAVTADRRWTELSIGGIEVRLFRGATDRSGQ